MQIKHSKTALNPDTGDASMVQPSDWNQDHLWTGPTIIDADTAYSILANGTGSYADIPSCFDDINKFVVGNQAKITVNLNAGIHNIPRTIEYLNRYTDNVQILGSAPLGDFTSSNVTLSGSAGAWVNVITVNQPIDTNVVVPGMYVMVTATALTTQPNRMWGCHKITAVTANSVTISNKNRNAAGPSGTTGLTFKIFTSVIKTGSDIDAIRVTNAAVGRLPVNFQFLKDVVLEGAGANNSSFFGLVLRSSSCCIEPTAVTYPQVGIVGFGRGILADGGSTLYANNRAFCVSDSGDRGVVSNRMSHILCQNCVITATRANSQGHGVYADNGAQIDAATTINTGSTVSFLAFSMSHIRAYTLLVNDPVTTTFSPGSNTFAITTNEGGSITIS